MFSREVILDISSTVVDESKEIVLIEFASLSSTNVTLRMTCMRVKGILLVISSLFVATVTVVDSQGRGFCVEAKYSLMELSVPHNILFFSTVLEHSCARFLFLLNITDSASYCRCCSRTIRSDASVSAHQPLIPSRSHRLP